MRLPLARIDDPRVVTIAVTAVVSAALWLATWQSMRGMSMDMMAMPVTAGLVVMTAVMWMLMMAAMMLPSMAPVLAVYAGAVARDDSGARLGLRIALFGCGYLAVWMLVSVALAIAQVAFAQTGFFAMGGTMAKPFAAGILLIVAGGYQLTPLKDTCLKHCRHPLTYLMSHWREGLAGAFPLGFGHGVYCVGCCIALMGLMFVFGAMSVFWMAVIAAYFLLEKTLPRMERIGRYFGIVLIIGGVFLLGRALLGV